MMLLNELKINVTKFVKIEKKILSLKKTTLTFFLNVAFS